MEQLMWGFGAAKLQHFATFCGGRVARSVTARIWACIVSLVLMRRRYCWVRHSDYSTNRGSGTGASRLNLLQRIDVTGV